MVGDIAEGSSTREFFLRNNSAPASGAAYIFIRNATGNWSQQNFLKASNIGTRDNFGHAVSISGDGFTVAIGAANEASNAVTINGDQNNNEEFAAGAVYVFVSNGGDWQQQAYIKAPVPVRQFGERLDISDDGNTLIASSSVRNAGRTVWVFVRENNRWSLQTQLPPPLFDNIGFGGSSISISGDGQTIAVGADRENSDAIGVNGNQDNQLALRSGAVYIYDRNGTTWEQQAYIKASNTDSGDGFGSVVSLSRDGLRLAVGAAGEDGFSVGG